MSGGEIDIARAVVVLGQLAGKSFDLELPGRMTNAIVPGTAINLLSTFD
jgi:hypothetical protein